MDNSQISLEEFTKVVKWFEYSSNFKKIIQTELKDSIKKEYFFIDSNWLENFKSIFDYQTLKLKIKKYKSNSKNENPLSNEDIYNLYLKYKDQFSISNENRKKIRINPNNNIILKDTLIKGNFLINNYYRNFIMLDKNIFEELKKGWIIGDIIKYDVIIGSGIFIIKLSHNDIEVGIFESIYKYKDIFLFRFADENDLNDELEKIKREGIVNYLGYYELNEKNDEPKFQIKKKKNGKDIIIINLKRFCEQIKNSTNIKDINQNEMDISKKRGLVNNDRKSSRLNSIIQILTSIKEIGDYLFQNKERIEKLNHIYVLSSIFIKIFEQLYNNINDGINKEINSEKLKVIINFIGPGIMAKSMDVFLSFILNVLHQELNESNKNKNEIITLVSYESPLMNEQDSLQKFQNYYQEYYNSVISYNINWIRKKVLTCQKCNESLCNFQAFPLLEFDLDSIHEYTIQQKTDFKQIIGKYKNNKDLLRQKIDEYKAQKKDVPIHITDCFKYYSMNKNDIEINCTKCLKNVNHTEKHCFYKIPKYFFILFNRRIKTSGIKIVLEDELNLDNYIEGRNEYKTYKLIGLLINTDLKEKEKHYIAKIRNFDQKWIKFDDEKVTQIKDEKEIYSSDTNKSRLIVYRGVKY